MELSEMKQLLDASERLVSRVPMRHRRYLCSRIDWNDRLICIKGPKGTGKTTLLLQHIREAFGSASDKAVYLAGDHIFFARHDVLDTVEFLHAHGYTHLFLDEVHHIPEWARIIKTVTDFYPELHVVYSGSSLLRLEDGGADLSRRQAVYTLKGLSFREYLSFEGALETKPLCVEEILSAHREIALDLVSNLKVLPFFEKYLKVGYYPLYRSVSSQFSERLLAVVNTILDVDFPLVEDVTIATIRKAKKMLMALAHACPQQPNMSDLYRELETNRNLGIRMLDALERAELIRALDANAPKLKHLSRPEKLYLGDTCLMHALVPSPNPGALRETFFANQLTAAGVDIKAPAQGDFMLNDTFLFEVGGTGKGYPQIRNVPQSFVVADGMEIGLGNKIPLWIFGMLY